MHNRVMAKQAGALVTPLRVLEDLFDGIPTAEATRRLDLSKIEALGQVVAVESDKLARMAHVTKRRSDLIYPGGWLGQGWHESVFRPELNCALLYEPKLLVHDPLAEYFFSDFSTLPESIIEANGMKIVGGARILANHGRRVHRGKDIEGIREDLERIFEVLSDFEPLIRSGVIVMRNQFPTLFRERHALESSVRKDMKSDQMRAVAKSASSAGGHLPMWDNVRGLKATPSDERWDKDDPAQWQPEFYHLSKTLAFSKAAGALYAPASQDELRLLNAKASEYLKGKRSDSPTRPVLEEALRLLAPDLTLSPAAAVTARESEPAFDAWRRELRDVQREAKDTERDDIPQLVEDRLKPRIDEVRKAVRKSGSLAARTKKNLTISAISFVGAAPAGLGAATINGVASGVGAYIVDTFGGSRADGKGVENVIAALMRE